MAERHQRVVSMVKQHAGPTLRAAFAYDAEDWQTLYVRDDLATADLQSVIPKLHQRAQAQEPLVPEEVYPGLGTAQATVELHDEAALIHLPESPTGGVVLTLDSEAARDLADFISRCTAVLDE